MHQDTEEGEGKDDAEVFSEHPPVCHHRVLWRPDYALRLHTSSVGEQKDEMISEGYREHPVLTHGSVAHAYRSDERRANRVLGSSLLDDLVKIQLVSSPIRRRKARTRRIPRQCQQRQSRDSDKLQQDCGPAAAIGALLSLNPHKVTTSQELAELNDEELSVSALSELSKQTHVGIAVGITGTAVEEGRKVSTSIKRAIHYTLGTNISQMLCLLITSCIPNQPPRNTKKNIFTSNFFIRTMYCGVINATAAVLYLNLVDLKESSIRLRVFKDMDWLQIMACLILIGLQALLVYDQPTIPRESELRNVVSSNLSFASPASTESHPAVTSKFFSPPDAVPLTTTYNKKN
ncbi:hypothetical protein BLNAU_18929 [Blattamonas nauphoetae]|uniref:Uncharacterized protein n=1 Tax=Blattamonas nauphoetae TaxID=2049346 RepID=A0ABQ9X5D7_9EUKA|nr:hypothetical protein BLNAU_18929 [Blattamonas nauphoetae]